MMVEPPTQSLHPACVMSSSARPSAASHVSSKAATIRPPSPRPCWWEGHGKAEAGGDLGRAGTRQARAGTAGSAGRPRRQHCAPAHARACMSGRTAIMESSPATPASAPLAVSAARPPSSDRARRRLVQPYHSGHSMTPFFKKSSFPGFLSDGTSPPAATSSPSAPQATSSGHPRCSSMRACRRKSQGSAPSGAGCS